MSEHDRREEPIRSPDRDDNLPPNPGPMTRLAHLFIDSRLTPLLAVAMLLIGMFAILLTPRE